MDRLANDGHCVSMSNDILVLGATGKVGRHVLDGLRAAGAPTRPAGRTGPVVFDWDRPDTWRPALDGVDRAYLIFPQLTTGPDKQIGELLDTAADTGLRRLVVLSAWGVDRAEGTGYRVAEQHIEASGLDWTILRPNWFLQNFDEGIFAPSIRTEGRIYAPTGAATVSFVDTRDIAAVAVAALTGEGHAGKGYPISGPAAVSFADVAAAVAAAAGRPVSHIDSTPEETGAALTAAGLPADYTATLLALYGQIRAGNAAAVTDVVERITHRPARSLARYTHEHASAWRTT